MDFIRYSRPKMPRNRYGVNNSIFVGSSAILEGGVSVTNNEETVVTQPTQIINNNETEWYNIQNKLVHSYENIKGTSEPRKDSEGNIMYDDNGDIKTRKQTKYLGTTWCTTVENFKPELRDSQKYRFLLLRLRKRPREGKKWRVPFFTPKFWESGDATQRLKMDIDIQDTWWPIQGTESKWWNQSQVEYTLDDGTIAYRCKTFKDVLPVNEENIKDQLHHAYTIAVTTDGSGKTFTYLTPKAVIRKVFKNVSSYKMLVGCAIYKNSDKGSRGWHRVSNIAVIEIRLTQKGHLLVTPREY